MKNKITILFILFSSHFILNGQSRTSEDSTNFIQVCLILDVSGSMKGLISQAQSHVWSLLAFMENFEKDNQSPKIEWGVVTYGNANFGENNFIHLETDFITDVDTLSDKLFLLKTGGGNEYAPEAIHFSLENLKWRKSEHAFKCIFIAGNEAFEQGDFDFETARKNAQSKGIILNTIFCGKDSLGRDLGWERAALLGAGEFASINQNIEAEKFKTPYDNKILKIFREYKNSFDKVEEEFFPKNDRSHFDYEIDPAYRDMLIYKYIKLKKRTDWIAKIMDGSLKFESLDKTKIPEAWSNLPLHELKKQVIKTYQKRSVSAQAMEMYLEKINEYLAINIGKTLQENTLNLAIEMIARVQLTEFGFVEKSKK
ncbi:MAG: vWA domain-containing protein [Bacteroidota bacterium]